MADVNIQEGYKDSAWFTANASIILLEGQKVNLEQTGTYKLGDGVTALSVLSFLGSSGGGAWGSITGTLADQTDLQNALDGKEPTKGVDDNYVTDAQLVVISNTSGTNTGNETASTLGATINAAASATPNDTDLVISVESSVVKNNTWTQIKSFLKTYFDTIYGGKPTARWYCDGTSTNPADNSAQYFGVLNTTPLATASVYTPTCTKTGAIYQISWTDFVATALGSGEGGTIEIQNITQATSETLTTNHLSTNRVSSSHLTSTLAFTAGDLFNVKRTNPAWATNPTSVYSNILITEY